MVETTEVNPSYRKVLDGLLRMHELSAAGEQETDEIKQLRDAIDEPYSDLSADERETIEGLSTDLFDVEKIISEPASDYRAMDGSVMAALRAQYSGHYDKALKLLRESESKPISRMSFFRGRNWSEKGEPKVALLFFNHAAKLDPRNDGYKAEALEAFVRAYPERAQKEITRLLTELPEGEPAVIIKACDIAFNEPPGDRDDENLRSLYKGIVKGLQLALAEMQEGPKRTPISEVQPVYSYVYSILASCCRYLGMVDQAYFYYTFAIGLDPFNDALLISRGALIYGRTQFATQLAVEDFDRALRLETSLAIPFYFIAHFLLHSEKFDDCLNVVDNGLQKHGSQRLKSEMLEFKAIALAATNRPPELVRKTFKEAELVDETNERVLSNLANYERDLAVPPAREPYILMIDPAMVRSEMPGPKSLRDTELAHHRIAG
jgi:tetratricopeptide (TPR) repeat protein